MKLCHGVWRLNRTVLGLGAVALLSIWSLIAPGGSCVCAHDRFLFGDEEQVSLWSEDYSLASSEAQSLNCAALVEAYLTQVDLGESANLARLSREVARLLPDDKPLLELLSLSLMKVQTGGRQKQDFQTYLKTYKLACADSGAPVFDSLFLRMGALRSRGFLLSASLLDSVLNRSFPEQYQAAAARHQAFSDLALGEKYMARRDFALARGAFERALSILQTEKTGEAIDEASIALAQLDVLSLDGGSKYISDLLAAMKARERLDRPQTEKIVALAIESIERRLSQLSAHPDLQALRTVLDEMKTVAFLSKLDGRLDRSGRLYRRLLALTNQYFADDSELAKLNYDLGETLFFDEMYSEAAFYFGKASQLRAPAALNAQRLDDLAMQGRSYLLGGNLEKAEESYKHMLAGLCTRLKIEGAAELSVAPQLVAKYQSQGVDERRQIDDVLQGLADVYVAGKFYDQALTCDLALLELRKQYLPPRPEAMQALYWQMAWVEQNALHNEEARKWYGKLIEEYPQENNRFLALWYQSKGLAEDALGLYKQAESDFTRAINYYLLHINRELKAKGDKEEIEKISWSIDDLRFNLACRKSFPLNKQDYYSESLTCFWGKARLPLAVYIPSGVSGFSGELREMFFAAAKKWTDFEGSPVSFKFVDSADNADIFVERVLTYDSIPYGSAGRTSALYVKEKAKDTRQLDKVHIRIYSASEDGVKPVALSSYAKLHLYTLFMHELGHALGLPHSPAGLDVMYWKAAGSDVTDRDKATLKKIYSNCRK